MVIGVLRRPLHANDLTVLHIAVQAAVMAGAADRAQRVLDLDPRIFPGDLCF